MTRNDPAPRPRRIRTGQLIAFQAVLIAGILGYTLTQGAARSSQPNQGQAVSADLLLLQQQPTLGNTGTRYDILIDLECPYCHQFLSGDPYATILQQAHDGQAQLNVTAAAFLNEKSVIKGSVYNCVAEASGPTAALSLIPALKEAGGDTNYWYEHALTLGAQHVDADTLQECVADGSAQERANLAFRTSGANGVPTVFVDGLEVAWPHVQPN